MCVLISKQYFSDIFVYFLLILKAANFRKIPAKEGLLYKLKLFSSILIVTLVIYFVTCKSDVI